MAYVRDRKSPEEEICPECGGPTSQDSADIGVGIIYGPIGCMNCGWSENEEYMESDKFDPLGRIWRRGGEG